MSEIGQRTCAAEFTQDSRERDVIAVVSELVRELHPQHYRHIDIQPKSRIERDLGIDSLSRIELVLRLERAFRRRVPTHLVSEAETVRDLMSVLDQLGPVPSRLAQITAATPVLPAVPAASAAETLVAVLEWHAARDPSRPHLSVLEDETTVIGALTYGELSRRSQNIARGLIAKDVTAGDRVALMLPTGIEFFIAFFGILYAGAIPVPIYPPMRMSQLEDHLRRQAGILRNAGACLLIATPESRQLASLLSAHVDSLRAIVSAADLEAAPAELPLPQIADPAAVALIQYTSGSTGDPKGVVLTHANLLANIRAMGAVMEANSSDVFVSWLPLYHDMGLIGAWLGCLYFAAPLYVMSPLTFLMRPEAWLWALHRWRATLSASPNFGFELCLNKIQDADLEGLDLGSVRMIANGAEPVSAQTLRRFIERYRRYGFAAQAMAPVYGLAECSVGLAFPPLNRAPVIDRIDRERLATQGIATPARPDDPRPLEVVACGQPLPGHDIRIVDELGRELGERREGRLEFRGPSATSGYFRNDKKTTELIRDGWLDSGDRAYMAGGDVYITGRIKDIIIRAGRHLYPQEIEAAVASIPGIRKGGVAVFGVADQASGTERVIVIAETQETDPAARAALQAQVLDVATAYAGTPPDEVVLVPPRTVPKTSSGKIRRSAARELYENNRIGVSPRSVRWQIVRLAFSAVRQKLRHARRYLLEWSYAVWWWIVIALAVAAGSLGVLLLPRLRWRWAALRGLARATVAAMGIRCSADGLDRIPPGNAILTFNHASYLDVLVLTAVLPGQPVFVAKRELLRNLLAGPLLRRLGIAFVERYDVSASLADADSLIALARQGRMLVFFPEGTFTRRAGLSEFYLGAFKVAAEAGCPIVPGVLRGTRSILRANQWVPRRGKVEVEIGEPIWPAGKDFQAVLQLRDAARQAMLLRCGEPDLGGLMKPAA